MTKKRQTKTSKIRPVRIPKQLQNPISGNENVRLNLTQYFTTDIQQTGAGLNKLTTKLYSPHSVQKIHKRCKSYIHIWGYRSHVKAQKLLLLYCCAALVLKVNFLLNPNKKFQRQCQPLKARAVKERWDNWGNASHLVPKRTFHVKQASFKGWCDQYQSQMKPWQKSKPTTESAVSMSTSNRDNLQTQKARGLIQLNYVIKHFDGHKSGHFSTNKSSAAAKDNLVSPGFFAFLFP